jgi:hypothetical protein
LTQLVSRGKQIIRVRLQFVCNFTDTLTRMACDSSWKDAVPEAVNQNNPRDLSELFHRLNNELGIILSHAELLEAKCDQDKQRSRAAQVVAAALAAMGTAKQIRAHVNELTLAK